MLYVVGRKPTHKPALRIGARRAGAARKCASSKQACISLQLIASIGRMLRRYISGGKSCYKHPIRIRQAAVGVEGTKTRWCQGFLAEHAH